MHKDQDVRHAHSHRAHFHRSFHDRILDLHIAVATGRHGDWAMTPEGPLALLLLTDKFPCNAFSGTEYKIRRP